MTAHLTTHAYVGIAPCGCIRAVVVIVPDRLDAAAQDVAEFVRDGLTIERVEVERMRATLCIDDHTTGCPHPGVCTHRPLAPVHQDGEVR